MVLVRGSVVLTMDGPAQDPVGARTGAAVRIEGRHIAEVGDLAPRPGEEVVEAPGHAVLPGFVQGHVHFCQTLFRHLADDRPLLPWLRERIWPLEAAHDEDSLRVSAELSLAELLRGGTTTAQVMETTRRTSASFAAAGGHPFTAVLGPALMDRAGPPELITTAAGAVAELEALHRQWHGHDRRLFLAVSPRFALSCSERLARSAAELAEALELRVHTHADEHPEEVAAVRAESGREMTAILADQGLLGPRTGLAHCVHTSTDERARLAATGTAVLHCPSTNLKLGSGIAPVTDYRGRGIPLALGADGAAANNRLCTFTEMRQAALLQALAAGPGSFPARDALLLATRWGAEALGFTDRGRLAPGRRADLVVVAVDGLALGPGGDPVARLVWAADRDHVRQVMAGGSWAVRDGRLVGIDEEALRARAGDALAAVLSRSGLSR